MKYFAGVDIGITGAIAIVDEQGTAVRVLDMPVLLVKKGKGMRHQIDEVSLAETLRAIMKDYTPVYFAVERQQSMPGQGVSSTFSFGVSYGIVRGMLALLGAATDYVHPTRWKRLLFDGMARDKDASRIRAKELFGNQVDLSLKKHHGRADALLIAEWRRRIG
jgi:Holliday junction resolvasome RuvABC endonuclease subunit